MCTRRGGTRAMALSTPRASRAITLMDAIPATSLESEWGVWNDPSSDQMINPLIGSDEFTDEWWNQSSELYELEYQVDKFLAQAGEKGPTIETVKVDELRAMQPSVRREGVRQYIKSMAQTGAAPLDSPADGKALTVYRLGGKLYVDDGNHRAVAAKLLGFKNIKARVYDFDKYMKQGAKIGKRKLKQVGLL